jgi:hypothetical protein
MSDKAKVKKGFMLVQFLKTYRAYNAGEKAMFQKARAEALIKAGVATTPGLIAKAKAAAAVVTDAKTTKRAPEVGKRATFLVPGLGEQEGVITEIDAEGKIKVRVGTEELGDLYDVEENELTVLD